jgi:hypothetical protein
MTAASELPTCDLLVAGSGGLSAAVTAASLGLKVLVLRRNGVWRYDRVVGWVDG